MALLSLLSALYVTYLCCYEENSDVTKQMVSVRAVLDLNFEFLQEPELDLSNLFLM
jgi:hypothetical protein